MIHYTTIYKLIKDGYEKIFQSEKEACQFLGVTQSTVASCYRRNSKCKGWTIERLGISSHGETHTRLYKIWEAMHERCERKSHKHYDNYGGRGISVCDEWEEYIPFRDWAIDNGYSDDLTLDRKNTDGNYSPDNCRWTNMKEQQNNKRNNRRLTWNGETKTIAEWSDIVGIKQTTIKERLKLGWSVEQALCTPVRKRTKGYRPSVVKMDGSVNDE